MNAIVIKEKLHDYIETGDEKLLKLLYALAKEYSDDEDILDFSDEEMQQLEQMRKDRLGGKIRTYSWAEAKEIIISGKQID